MKATRNHKNLRQHKGRFSFILEQKLAFTLSTGLVRDVKNLELANCHRNFNFDFASFG